MFSESQIDLWKHVTIAQQHRRWGATRFMSNAGELSAGYLLQLQVPSTRPRGKNSTPSGQQGEDRLLSSPFNHPQREGDRANHSPITTGEEKWFYRSSGLPHTGADTLAARGNTVSVVEDSKALTEDLWRREARSILRQLRSIIKL